MAYNRAVCLYKVKAWRYGLTVDLMCICICKDLSLLDFSDVTKSKKVAKKFYCCVPTFFSSLL